jgi:serralysin
MNLPKHWRLAGGLTATAAVVGAGVAAVAFSGSASATSTPATLAFDGRYLTYTAAPGQTNHLSVTRTAKSVPSDAYGAAEYTFTLDDSVSIQLGAGAAGNNCTHPTSSDLTLVVCTYVFEDGQDPGRMADFKVGDKNDVVKFHDVSEDTYNTVMFELGAGADTYTADAKRTEGSRILGGPGNDTITTGVMAGDMTGVLGGTGNDTIRVQGATAAPTQGGTGNDKLYGDSAGQAFDGGSGNDLVHAGAGKDSIVGGKGNDKLYGEAGADTIHGNAGNDKLYGGAGTDTLIGGPGKDVIKQN